MVSFRKRLLASTVTTIIGSVALVAPQAALADCTVAAGAVTCATTATTDTTNAGGTPAVNRNYPVDTSAAAFTGTISTGAVVDGFGLAFTNTVGGANPLNIVNNGTVQVNVGNTATAGLSGAAIFGSAIGATALNYSGNGDVLNLGPGAGAAGDALSLLSTGTGNITATIGGSLAARGVNTYGLWVRQQGTAGNISVTTTAGETITADSSGIIAEISDVTSAGTLTIVNNAAIGSIPTALNTLDVGIGASTGGTGAVSVTNNGAIGSATDRLQSNGINAGIGNATSAAALGVSGSGAIFAADDGINAITFGTGNVTVNYTGAINVTTGNAIEADSTTGNIVVTTGAGALTTTAALPTIDARASGAGNVTVTTGAGAVSGGFTGITASTNGGNGTVTTGAGAVTGTDFGIQAVNLGLTGTQAVTANGVVTGGLQTGIRSLSGTARTITVGTAGNVTGGTQAIELVGDGATVITNNGIIGAASTGLALSNIGAGAVTMTNATTGTLNGRLTLNAGADTLTNSGIFNTLGTTDFGTGADAFSNTATGVINILGATTFANLETFTQNGRLNLNNNVFTGPAVAFVNGGSGYVDTSGSAALAGFTSVTNNGTFDLAAGTLTVPAGVFTNAGILFADEGLTTITGQTSFVNSGTIDLLDGATGDILTISSSYSGGGTLQVDTTSLVADQLIVGAISGTTFVDVNGLDNGFINPLGVLVVDGTSSSAGAFVIGDQFGSPLVNYDIRQSGADYFIVTGPSQAAFQPLILAAAASDIWYQSADEVIAQTRLPNDLDGVSFWGQIYGSKDKSGENDQQVVNGFVVDADNKTDNTRYGAQLGVDIGVGAIGRIGLTGGYEHAEVDGAAEIELEGWNVGVYGMFGGPLGFHGEALFKYDDFDIDVDSGPFNGESSGGKSTGIDAAIGYRFAAGWVPTLDINAGVSHVWTSLDGIGAFGFDYDYDNFTSTRARAGIRAIFAGKWRPYLDLTGYHEFDGEADVELFDGVNSYEISRDGKGSWARLEGGLGGYPSSGPILAVWGDVGDRKGFGIRAGFRFGGARVEEALPPPPPPPPPPPHRRRPPPRPVPTVR